MEQEIFERRRQSLKDFLYLPLFYLIPDEIALLIRNETAGNCIPLNPFCKLCR